MSHPLFSIIDNEVRVHLILCIAEQSKTVNELVQNCCLSQSAVSQHLQKLRLAKIVSVEKKGREVYYSINDPEVVTICRSIQNYIRK